MVNVFTLRAFGDNFVYLVEYQPGRVVAVDPGDASVVFLALKEHGLTLDAILVTHDHHDHTGGVCKLLHKTGCRVVTPGNDVRGGEVLEFGEVRVRVIATPGHTGTSVCYYAEPCGSNSDMVFTGDTLFAGGCGRVFGGSFEDMYQSLQTLAGLPDDTLVYPGHDYTEENYRFALTVEPGNADVKEMLGSVGTAHPTTIGDEKRTNVFIRAESVGEFERLRKLKDRF